MGKIVVGNTVFVVLKRDGRRVLVEWVEKSGIIKTRWLIITEQAGQVLAKVG